MFVLYRLGGLGQFALGHFARLVSESSPDPFYRFFSFYLVPFLPISVELSTAFGPFSRVFADTISNRLWSSWTAIFDNGTHRKQHIRLTTEPRSNIRDVPEGKGASNCRRVHLRLQGRGDEAVPLQNKWLWGNAHSETRRRVCIQ